MKNQLLFLFLIAATIFGSCKQSSDSSNGSSEAVVSGYQDLTVKQFKSLIGTPNTVLLDVRTPEEIAEGKIEGAIELDFYEDGFENRVTTLNKELTYLIYCRSGNRSGQTCALMQKNGFKHLNNLKGGFTAWSETSSESSH